MYHFPTLLAGRKRSVKNDFWERTVPYLPLKQPHSIQCHVPKAHELTARRIHELTTAFSQHDVVQDETNDENHFSKYLGLGWGDVPEEDENIMTPLNG